MGLKVSHLLAMISPQGYSKSNNASLDILNLQAEAIGAELVTGMASWEDYEDEYRKALHSVAPGVEGCIFGDIDIEGHRDWCRRIAAEVNLKCMHPIWGKRQEDLIARFIGLGFKAVISVVNIKYLGIEWLGRPIDQGTVEEMVSLGVSPCGELGEYHTIVTAGPIFQRPVPVEEAGRSLLSGYGFLTLRPRQRKLDPPGPQ
jgi:uncharacterized protein (TIGR00290 family)